MALDEWVNGYAETFAEYGLIASQEELIESMGSFRRRIHEHWGQSKEIADMLVAPTHQRAEIDSILYYPPENESFYDLNELLKYEPTYVANSFTQIEDILLTK